MLLSWEALLQKWIAHMREDIVGARLDQACSFSSVEKGGGRKWRKRRVWTQLWKRTIRLGNNEAKNRASNNQMDKQWSQHGQKYQWFVVQNRGWALMYVTAKKSSIRDCQEGGTALATLWSWRWEAGKAIKKLHCSSDVWWSNGVPEQRTHPPLWGHFASHGSRWYQSSHCPLSYRLPAAEGKEGMRTRPFSACPRSSTVARARKVRLWLS